MTLKGHGSFQTASTEAELVMMLCDFIRGVQNGTVSRFNTTTPDDLRLKMLRMMEDAEKVRLRHDDIDHANAVAGYEPPVGYRQ